jgi:ribosomal-protein-alanine N-acetyltransferase
MTGVRIEGVGLEMSAHLAVLHKVCFDPLPEMPWSETALRTILRMPGTRGIAAIPDNGEPAGFLIGRETADEAEILTICVALEYRRAGLAQKLLTHYLGQETTARRVVLEVATDNTAAIALYTGLQFQQVGRRPNYYGHGAARTDALIMARESTDILP